MSVEATVWARAQSGKIKSPSARLVLWAIAFRADADGQMNCSRATIAADTGLDRSNVFRHIRSLCDAGLLVEKVDGNLCCDVADPHQNTLRTRTMQETPRCGPAPSHVADPQQKWCEPAPHKDKTIKTDRLTDCLSDFSSDGDQPETSPPAAPAQRVCNETEAPAPSCQPTTAERVARRLAELYAGPLGSPGQHMETAQALVNSNMDLFGERRVLAAIAAMERARANGKRFQSLWSAFASYCEKVATPKTEEEQEKEESLAEYRRQLAIIAGPSAEYAYARPAE